MANDNTWPQDLIEILKDPIFDDITIRAPKNTELELLKETLFKVSAWIKEKERFPDKLSSNAKEIEIYGNLQALKKNKEVLKKFDEDNILY